MINMGHLVNDRITVISSQKSPHSLCIASPVIWNRISFRIDTVYGIGAH